MEPGPESYYSHSVSTGNVDFQCGNDPWDDPDAPYTPNCLAIPQYAPITPDASQPQQPPEIYQVSSLMADGSWPRYAQVTYGQMTAQRELIDHDHDYFGVVPPTLVDLSVHPQHSQQAIVHIVQHQSTAVTSSSVENVVIERYPNVPRATKSRTTVKVPKTTKAAAPRTASAERLEKKRERNKLAAARCRKRRLDRIEYLQQELENHTKAKKSLESTVQRLKQEVEDLRTQLARVVDRRA
ncbi:jun [Aphelenchoides avenae]|nr:jun [Aphelenchus avenae]